MWFSNVTGHFFVLPTLQTAQPAETKIQKSRSYLPRNYERKETITCQIKHLKRKYAVYRITGGRDISRNVHSVISISFSRDTAHKYDK